MNVDEALAALDPTGQRDCSAAMSVLLSADVWIPAGEYRVDGPICITTAPPEET